MGKASRAKVATRITLRRDDFFQLSAAVKELALARAQAAERVRQQIPTIVNDLVAKDVAHVQSKVQTLITALGKTYHFDPTINYRFDEATCALVPVDSGRGEHLNG